MCSQTAAYLYHITSAHIGIVVMHSWACKHDRATLPRVQRVQHCSGRLLACIPTCTPRNAKQTTMELRYSPKQPPTQQMAGRWLFCLLLALPFTLYAFGK